MKTQIINSNNQVVILESQEANQIAKVLGIVSSLQKDLQDNPNQPLKQLELLSEFREFLAIENINPDTLFKVMNHIENI